MNDAIYVVEYRSISQGIGALDTMVKSADLTLLHANPICIGKYLICLGGDVADVEEAKTASYRDEGGAPMAAYLLTGTHPDVLGYFKKAKPMPCRKPEAIGIIETKNASSGFMSLDRSLKAASVCLLRLWLGQLLGGKFCYVLGGSVSDVQAAVNAAKYAIEEKELVGTRVIPSPDEATMNLFLRTPEI